DVRIVGFGRSHNPGRPPLDPELDARLREFWAEYFREGGASVTGRHLTFGLLHHRPARAVFTGGSHDCRFHRNHSA
ncbi:MAG: hypothetical protein KKE52_03760, partial [Alphaproteobacteria bacterium]|nr:hypothetical protein [Alphaproteobacteria bacterium]